MYINVDMELMRIKTVGSGGYRASCTTENASFPRAESNAPHIIAECRKKMQSRKHGQDLAGKNARAFRRGNRVVEWERLFRRIGKVLHKCGSPHLSDDKWSICRTATNRNRTARRVGTLGEECQKVRF